MTTFDIGLSLPIYKVSDFLIPYMLVKDTIKYEFNGLSISKNYIFVRSSTEGGTPLATTIQMQIFNFGGDNILTGIDENSIVYPEDTIGVDEHPFLFKSDTLLGAQLFDIRSSLIKAFSFILVENDFDIFGLLGWIGSLVNDVLSMIGANSGYSLELNLIKSYNINTTKILNSPIYNSGKSQFANSVFDEDGFIFGYNPDSQLFAFSKNNIFYLPIFSTDLQTYTTFYDCNSKTSYFISNLGNFALDSNGFKRLDVPFSVNSFGGIINDYYYINGNFYDSDFMEVVGPILPSGYSIIACYGNYGYAVNSENTHLVRFTYDDGWIVGVPVIVPIGCIADNSFLIMLDDGLVYMCTLDYIDIPSLSGSVQVKLNLYKLSIPFNEIISFPVITSSKICGC